jgi:hypothetical protein
VADEGIEKPNLAKVRHLHEQRQGAESRLVFECFLGPFVILALKVLFGKELPERPTLVRLWYKNLDVGVLVRFIIGIAQIASVNWAGDTQ